MRDILFTILLAVMCGYGCSLEPVHSGVQVDFNREEILKELSAFSDQAEFAEGPESKEEKIRKQNLIPDEEFLEDVPSLPKSFVDESLPANTPKEFSLASRDTPVKRQNNGRCSAFSLVAGVENLLNREGQIPNLDLSEEHLWSKYKVYSAQAAIRALSKEENRIGDEKDWPKEGRAKPTLFPHTYVLRSTYIGDSPAAAVKALLKGYPIYLAMKTPKSMLSCPSSGVINPYSAPSSGGHAILGTGFLLDDKNGVVLEIKNSWGVNCSKKGYQFLPLSICKRSGFYCNMWSLEAVDSIMPGTIPDIDPTPGTTPEPKDPQAKPVEYKTVCSRSIKHFFRKVCRKVPVN